MLDTCRPTHIMRVFVFLYDFHRKYTAKKRGYHFIEYIPYLPPEGGGGITHTHTHTHTRTHTHTHTQNHWGHMHTQKYLTSEAGCNPIESPSVVRRPIEVDRGILALKSRPSPTELRRDEARDSASSPMPPSFSTEASPAALIRIPGSAVIGRVCVMMSLSYVRTSSEEMEMDLLMASLSAVPGRTL